MTDAARAPQKISLEEAFALAVHAGQTGEPVRAEQLYRAVLKARPVSEAARNLGLLLDAQSRWDETEIVYRQHLEAQPDDPVIRLQLAFLLLRAGRYAEAWPHYEARVLRPGAHPKPSFGFPEWTGEPIGSLLIWQEQGLGDQIQFARHAKHLAESGMRVTLVADPRLVRLFRPLGVTVAPAGVAPADLPPHDAWIMAGSLPWRCGASLQTLSPEPYLPGRDGGVGIGVVTAGKPTYANDANRSLPADIAAELRALPGAVSLALEDTGATDMEDTRALVERLELVISVDTAVAHLAGAMGKPCWLLTPHAADWRWMRERTDSPWYPSVRLFRQPGPGDWRSVMDAVKQALA